MTSLIVVALWALAANLVAMLPHNTLHWNLARLLVLAIPVILWLVGQEFGIPAVLVFILVVISLFRLPLAHLFKYLTGQIGQGK